MATKTIIIVLPLLIGLLFSSSAALSSDTGLMCAIDMGSNTFRLMVGEMTFALDRIDSHFAGAKS